MKTLKSLKDVIATMKSKEEPKKVEVVQEAPIEKPVTVEDRSAFNCKACKGEGMVFTTQRPQGEICTVCLGTGKV